MTAIYFFFVTSKNGHFTRILISPYWPVFPAIGFVVIMILRDQRSVSQTTNRAATITPYRNDAIGVAKISGGDFEHNENAHRFIDYMVTKP